MARARRPSLLEQERIEQRLFESVSREFNAPLTHVRYVSYRFHTGASLSISHEWQVLEDGQWQRRAYNESGPIENMPGPKSRPR